VLRIFKNKTIMEQLNRIEIRGIVGNVRLQNANRRNVAHISVATSRAYKNMAGEPVIDTTWHSVNAWEGKNITELAKIEKGSKVHVLGRMSASKFSGTDGAEKTSYEIQANLLEIIDDPSPLAYEA